MASDSAMAKMKGFSHDWLCSLALSSGLTACACLLTGIYLRFLLVSACNEPQCYCECYGTLFPKCFVPEIVGTALQELNAASNRGINQQQCQLKLQLHDRIR